MADTGLMLARIRGWFDGAGWFPGLAAALFVFALLAVLLELQSSDAVRWTGQSVTGTEIGGIVSYRWDGQTYSLSAQGYGSAKTIGVVLDPADPSNAVIDNTFRGRAGGRRRGAARGRPDPPAAVGATADAQGARDRPGPGPGVCLPASA
jgi:hypothetical protein